MSAIAESVSSYAGHRPALIDANVYAALILAEHKGHLSAHRWLATQADVACCPLVELAVLRLLMRALASGGCGLSAARARRVVTRFRQSTALRMLVDDVEPMSEALPWRHVIGHNQINDAYLIALAEVHHLRVCTFDRGFMSLFSGPDSALVELLAFDPE